MNRRLLTILLSAFLTAAVASYVVYRIVGKEVNVRDRDRIQTVVVASRDLDLGVLIKADDLKTREIVGKPQKGAIVKAETAVGRGVISKIYEGETVQEDRLAPIGSGGGMAATIPAGMRACAVKVNDVAGVAGFAIPGMRVDVLVSGSAAGGAVGIRAKTLLENIQVLSAGPNFQRDAEGKPVSVQVVNLLVTPEQAQLLSLASNESKMQLVLRNPADTGISKPAVSAMASLYGDDAPVAPKPAAPMRPAPPPPVVIKVETPAVPVRPQVRSIQVMNGGKISEQTFTKSGTNDE
jgi:pilus assembly protein CpaB